MSHLYPPTSDNKYVGFFHTGDLSASQAPTECVTVQLGSDTIYPGVVQTPHVKGSAPHLNEKKQYSTS